MAPLAKKQIPYFSPMSIDPNGRCMRACAAAKRLVRASKRAIGFLRRTGLQFPRGLPREYDERPGKRDVAFKTVSRKPMAARGQPLVQPRIIDRLRDRVLAQGKRFGFFGEPCVHLGGGLTAFRDRPDHK